MGSTTTSANAAAGRAAAGADVYDLRTIRLHWLTAFLVATLWLIAQLIDDFPKGLPRVLVRSTHITIGVLLVLVVARRIAWRARRGRRLETPAPRWLAHAARAGHWLLYAGLVGVLVLGMANAWARGDSVFGLFSIPKLLPGHPALKGAIEYLHRYAANALLILAGLHGVAALWHHFVLKDGVLRRMLGR